MSRYPWFRMFSEARADAKLRSLSDAEFRVWFNLLCLAAENEERRGSVDTSDPFILALEVANGDEELLSRTCHALSRLKVVTCDDVTLTFIKFEARQYDKPSDTPEETRERKKRSRAKAQQSPQESDVSRDVTRSHDTREEKRRGEEIENGANAPAREPTLIYSAEFEAFWTNYPKGHGSKKSTYAQWRKLKPDAALVDEIMAGLAAWNRSDRWKRDVVVDAMRWVRDRLWENPPVEAGAASSVDGKPYFDGTQYRRADGLVV